VSWNTHGTEVQTGDLVELVGLNHKHFITVMKIDGELQTHRGVLKHSEVIGKPWGSQVRSHMGSPFFVLQPSLADLLREIKRNTQIIYPKDIGFILLRLGIGPGSRVGEAGTGSGALTTAMAFYIGDEGRIYTYENREESYLLAKKNLEKVGLSNRVEFKNKDLSEGFDETNLDAIFLDMNNSYDFMRQVRAALKPGGFFATILPTSNQVCRILEALKQERFAFVEVVEISLRFFKPEPMRFRPVDRMVAHTGYLIFARPVTFDDKDEIAMVVNDSEERES